MIVIKTNEKQMTSFSLLDWNSFFSINLSLPPSPPADSHGNFIFLINQKWCWYKWKHQVSNEKWILFSVQRNKKTGLDFHWFNMLINSMFWKWIFSAWVSICIIENCSFERFKCIWIPNEVKNDENVNYIEVARSVSLFLFHFRIWWYSAAKGPLNVS